MCVSKIASGSTTCPVADLSQPANRTLASRLALRIAARNALSPASGSSFCSWSRSVIQPSPMASVITAASGGFASRRKRRCVTPLVLLLNRAGKSAAKSGTTVRVSSSE